jgi:hypothetical protein
MIRPPFALLAAFLPAVAACGNGTEPCLPVAHPAVDVEVRDAQTDELRADSARGVARDGTYSDSLVVVRAEGAQSVPAALGGAWDRPGTYSVRIERAGYQPWDTVGIHVHGIRCGVVAVQLVAHLSRVP